MFSKCPIGREDKQHVIIYKSRKSVKIHGKSIKKFIYLAYRGNTSRGYLVCS